MRGVGAKANQIGAAGGCLHACCLLGFTGGRSLVRERALSLVLAGEMLAVAFGEPAAVAAVFGHSLAIDINGVLGIVRNVFPRRHGLELFLDELIAFGVDFVR